MKWAIDGSIRTTAFDGLIRTTDREENGIGGACQTDAFRIESRPSVRSAILVETRSGD